MRLLTVGLVGLLACADGAPPDRVSPDSTGETADPVAMESTPRDWEIAVDKVRWAQSAQDGEGFGDLIGSLGETFLGTAYVPHTLEVPGEERLVVNLQALDCVTFVENVLVLARLARSLPPEALESSPRFRDAFQEELTRIRYRGGVLDGYASRLHYFSEWLDDNEAKGVVDHVSEELGGVVDPSAVDFMSAHPDAYAQLEDEMVLSAIAQIEAALGEVERYYIPEDQIEARSPLIRTGDVIAATSTVAGLDVAHTGIAVWKEGSLRLLHAPLVGSSVELSEESLADRIRRIDGQDGIMVARPLDPRAG